MGRVLSTEKKTAALGRNFDKLRQKINIVDEMKGLSFVKAQQQMAPFLEATWRLLSGFEHGLGWALLDGTDREVQAETPGGMAFQLVIKDEQFVNVAKSTYFMLISA